MKKELLKELQAFAVWDNLEEYIVKLLAEVPTRRRTEEHLLRLALEGKQQTPYFLDAEDGRRFVILESLPAVDPQFVPHPIIWFGHDEMKAMLQRRGSEPRMSTHAVASLLCSATAIETLGTPGETLGLFRSTAQTLLVRGAIEAINTGGEFDDRWYSLVEVAEGNTFWVINGRELWVFTRAGQSEWDVMLSTL